MLLPHLLLLRLQSRVLLLFPQPFLLFTLFRSHYQPSALPHFHPSHLLHPE